MGKGEQTGADQGEQAVAGGDVMYIMRKMNREKKAATEAERAALLADGYRECFSLIFLKLIKVLFGNTSTPSYHNM